MFVDILYQFFLGVNRVKIKSPSVNTVYISRLCNFLQFITAIKAPFDIFNNP